MSEQIHHGHEHGHNNHELKDHGQEKLNELIHEQASKARHEHKEQIDELRQETRAEALPAATVLEQQRAEEAPAMAAQHVNRDLKDMKFKRTLQSVQKDLSAPEKVLSKVMHNPIVDALSEGAENTIARPSGLLAGSIFAFIGSSSFLWIAKHYGYTYNYLLMTLFFVGGFFLGLLVELGLRFIKKSPRS